MSGQFLGIQIPLHISRQTRAQTFSLLRSHESVLSNFTVEHLTAAGLNWTAHTNMHSTLQWRGDDRDILPSLANYAALCADTNAFVLNMGKPYAFQSGRIAYLCAELGGNLGSWKKLSVGTVPHVTLARMDTIAFEGSTLLSQRWPMDDIADVLADWQSPGFVVREVQLFQSEAGVYTPIRRFPLRAPRSTFVLDPNPFSEGQQ